LAFGLWGDLKVTKLIDARGQLSKDQVKERLAQEIATAELHRVQYWPIFLLSNDEHIGCCGLRPYDVSEGVYEIGFQICSKHWKRGFASEGTRAVMEYAFDKLGVSGLFAGHSRKNEASRHLLEKLGFRYSHDEYYAPTGLNHPSYMMSVAEYARLKDSDW
jgi:RimJ/RimL family protein N-acetyltransferase